ncbi:hypothetical protein PAXRUDRAFT_291148 [Paxillus rubicundulus Ve08.2h10]|uniref:Unplaced genomic scaffold scaffold_1536, whole genome shotgun sequence n=1 Tax=Paxillus rubicundulus Ve08.2h10 TaxID=930991 RepID=A0A0D0DE94_9AGAM|nr:hypothetical protein PAXRUDRAFT_291148 [Paxillus rubicundulus Ve08.2h10]
MALQGIPVCLHNLADNTSSWTCARIPRWLTLHTQRRTKHGDEQISGTFLIPDIEKHGLITSPCEHEQAILGDIIETLNMRPLNLHPTMQLGC